MPSTARVAHHCCVRCLDPGAPNGLDIDRSFAGYVSELPPPALAGVPSCKVIGTLLVPTRAARLMRATHTETVRTGTTTYQKCNAMVPYRTTRKPISSGCRP